MTLRQLVIGILCTVMPLSASADKPLGGGRSGCPAEKVEAERLPDLHIPRVSHSAFCVNGEVTVVGGHTSGFVPTATAEYFRDGEWHLMQTVYPHDLGLSIPMKSGEVMLAGGYEQALGVEQTFTVELYDPASHRFRGFGCLDKKRAQASCVELDSGRVYISGNWYHADGIECFSGDNLFSGVKEVAQARSMPYIFRTAPDNAIIFSGIDEHGQPIDTILVDRLQGDPFTVPMFETWRPFYVQFDRHSRDCFIGDEAQGSYAYLFPVQNAAGQLAIAKAEGERFSLLPTACPVPMKSPFGRVSYFSYVVVDRQAQCAYVMGFGGDEGDDRLYVLRIGYASSPAPLTLYYTDPLPGVGVTQPVLTAEGDLVLAGGVYARKGNNFDPYASAVRIALGRSADKRAAWASGGGRWLLLAALLIVVAGGPAALLLRRKGNAELPGKSGNSRNSGISGSPGTSGNSGNSSPPGTSGTSPAPLMLRINSLVESQRLYLRSELKVSDIADALGISARQVSDCIRDCRGSSFANYINAYRVEYVQQLLRTRPDQKISSLCAEAGFANEPTFFRIFKSITGTTPKEWLLKQQSEAPSTDRSETGRH